MDTTRRYNGSVEGRRRPQPVMKQMDYYYACICAGAAGVTITVQEWVKQTPAGEVNRSVRHGRPPGRRCVCMYLPSRLCGVQ